MKWQQVILETLVAMNIPRIVYVSCNPAILVRDLGILAKDRLPDTESTTGGHVPADKSCGVRGKDRKTVNP